MGRIPALSGYFLQGTERADETGVIKGDIEPAEFIESADDQGLDVIFGRHVSFLKHCAAAVLLTITYRCGPAVFVQISDHYCGPFTRKTNCRGPAHATCCPSYHCDFIIESVHRDALLRS